MLCTQSERSSFRRAKGRNTPYSSLNFLEPLLSSTPPFRPHSTIRLPGLVEDITFFSHTIAVVTEKAFLIAEPGSTTFNPVPSPAASSSKQANGAAKTPKSVERMLNTRRFGMWQLPDSSDFILVHEAGACFCTKSKLRVWFWNPVNRQREKSRAVALSSDGTSSLLESSGKLRIFSSLTMPGDARWVFSVV